MANYVYIGSVSNPSFYFDDDSIISLHAEMACNVISQELTADAFELEVEYDDSDRELRELIYATSIFYYKDNEKVAMFYFTNIKRTGKTRYLIYATSFIGLLDKEPSYGGMFVGTSFKNMIYQIVCADGVEQYVQLNGFTQRKTTEGGSNQYGVLMSEDGFGDATYTSRIEIKFKCTYFVGSYANVICGSAKTNTSSVSSGTYYGITTYPGSGKYSVNLYYNGSSKGLLTNVNVGDIVTISVDPTKGKATASCDHGGTITTNTVQITAGSDSIYTRLYTGGFGRGFLNTEAVDTSSSNRFYYYYYRVYDKNDNLLLDVVPLFNMSDGQLYLRNTVTGYKVHPVCASFDEDDIYYSDSAASSDILSMNDLKRTILDGMVFDEDILNLRAYGWLPVGTKREALYQLLFSLRVSIVRDPNGFRFTRLVNELAGSISDDSIYDIGSVEEKEDVYAVELVEHNYDSYGNSTEIFNNIESYETANNSLVQFSNAPIYGAPVIAETSGTFKLIAYNCNAAIVTGRGKLTGTPYLHGKKTLRGYPNGTVRGKTVSVTDATMVTALNSTPLLEKLVAFYEKAYKVSNSIVYGNTEVGDPLIECGSRYSFRDCFEESQAGFLQKMSLSGSGITKADCDFIGGFTNPESGEDYTHSVRLTGSGTWEVPEGVTRFRAIIIGAGNGGDGGHAGQDGDRPRYYDGNEWRTTVKAEGGDPGVTGDPGKIYTVVVNDVASSYTYSCGAGGVGGNGATHDGTSPGGVGGETSLVGGGVTYSSANGSIIENGFIDYFTGYRYAFRPPYWSNGAGKGGDGGYYKIDYEGNVTFYEATSAYNEIEDYTRLGGMNGSSVYVDGMIVATGGCGGGGTLMKGSNIYVSGRGYDGTDAYYDAYSYWAGKGGDAGGYNDGMPAASLYYIPEKGYYGVGGIGGVGGGAGGAGGTVKTGYHWGGAFVQSRGVPGGKGGDGGDGCIIIYY